jgi:hypothetical protein
MVKYTIERTQSKANVLILAIIFVFFQRLNVSFSMNHLCFFRVLSTIYLFLLEVQAYYHRETNYDRFSLKIDYQNKIILIDG